MLLVLLRVVSINIRGHNSKHRTKLGGLKALNSFTIPIIVFEMIYMYYTDQSTAERSCSVRRLPWTCERSAGWSLCISEVNDLNIMLHTVFFIVSVMEMQDIVSNYTARQRASHHPQRVQMLYYWSVVAKHHTGRKFLLLKPNHVPRFLLFWILK